MEISLSFLSDQILEESIATKIFGDKEDTRFWLLKETVCNSLAGLIEVWFNEKFKGLWSWVVPRGRSTGVLVWIASKKT